MRRTEQAQGLRLMKFAEVYGRTRCGVLSQAEAAEILGVSERTFRRWRDRFEAEGAEGLYDRRLTTSPQAQQHQQKRSTHMVHKPVSSDCSRHAYNGQCGSSHTARFHRAAFRSDAVCPRNARDGAT